MAFLLCLWNLSSIIRPSNLNSDRELGFQEKAGDRTLDLGLALSLLESLRRPTSPGMKLLMEPCWWLDLERAVAHYGEVIPCKEITVLIIWILRNEGIIESPVIFG